MMILISIAALIAALLTLLSARNLRVGFAFGNLDAVAFAARRMQFARQCLRQNDGARRMVLVHFTPNLRRHVDCPSMTVEGETVRSVLQQVLAANPRLETYVLDDQRHLRKHMRILVNGQAIRDLEKQSDAVKADDEVWVVQALSGG